MRVLFITPISSLYGANKSLLTLIEYLTNNDIECLVGISSKGRIAQELDNKNIAYFNFPFFTSVISKDSRLKTLKATIKFISNIPALVFFLIKIIYFRPKIIYSNSSITSLGYYLSAITSIKHIWHIREFGESDYNLTQEFGVKYFKWKLSQADHIICVSKAVKNYFKLSEQSYSVSVIYNGVFSEQLFKLIDSSNVKRFRNTTRLVIAGAISENKGQRIAVKAISILRKKYDITLNIYGEGSQKDYMDLRDLINKLELKNYVHIKKYSTNIFKVLKKQDILLVCSTFEAMGRITAEGLVSGIPIVGNDSAGTRELLQRGKYGYLYQGSSNSLANSIEKLLNNKKRAALKASQAQKFAKKAFSAEKYGSRVHQILTDI